MDPIYQNPDGPNATEITNWKPDPVPSLCSMNPATYGGKRRRVLKSNRSKKSKKSKNVKRKWRTMRKR